MSKTRLDVCLVEKGLAETREKARATIMSGVVFVDGRRADKPGMGVPENCTVEIRGSTLRYVSRGGLKLEKALKYFDFSPEGMVCIDCGASTGGFTDCLLQNGAKKVFSIDVGYGQLAWSLRNDSRVTVMERTNIRNVSAMDLGETADMAVIDVSFISLKIVLPVIRNLIKEDGAVICLIKPQFEAGKEKVGKKGVVRDEKTHREVLENFIANAYSAGFSVRDITFSPVRGPEGNIEYLGYLVSRDEENAELDPADVVHKSHMELKNS